MAAALLERHAAGPVDVRSAGSSPADEITPPSHCHDRDRYRPRGAHPKPRTSDAVHASDVVVTMGCGDTCPIFPGKRYEDWVLDDPAGQDLDTVRGIRDAIRARVKRLLDELRTPRPA